MSKTQEILAQVNQKQRGMIRGLYPLYGIFDLAKIIGIPYSEHFIQAAIIVVNSDV